MAESDWRARCDPAKGNAPLESCLAMTMHTYGTTFDADLTAASSKVAERVFAIDHGIDRMVRKLLKDGGRYRIRTYDFHRVKMALYR